MTQAFLTGVFVAIHAGSHCSFFVTGHYPWIKYTYPNAYALLRLTDFLTHGMATIFWWDITIALAYCHLFMFWWHFLKYVPGLSTMLRKLQFMNRLDALLYILSAVCMNFHTWGIFC